MVLMSTSYYVDNELPFKNESNPSPTLETTSVPVEHVNSADVAPKTLMAAEGFLAICGGCRVKMHTYFLWFRVISFFHLAIRVFAVFTVEL